MSAPLETPPPAATKPRRTPAGGVSFAHREPSRAPWSRPRLRRLGELRSVTLGPSPGLGESSNPAIFRV